MSERLQHAIALVTAEWDEVVAEDGRLHAALDLNTARMKSLAQLLDDLRGLEREATETLVVDVPALGRQALAAQAAIAASAASRGSVMKAMDQLLRPVAADPVEVDLRAKLGLPPLEAPIPAGTSLDEAVREAIEAAHPPVVPAVRARPFNPETKRQRQDRELRERMSKHTPPPPDQTRRMRVLRAMTGKGPMPFRAIAEAIGDTTNLSSLSTVLNTMLNEKLLTKPKYGWWECHWLPPVEEKSSVKVYAVGELEPVAGEDKSLRTTCAKCSRPRTGVPIGWEHRGARRRLMFECSHCSAQFYGDVASLRQDISGHPALPRR